MRRSLDWKIPAVSALLGVAALAGWLAGQWSVGAATFLGAMTLWLVASELRLRWRVERLAEQGRQLAGEVSRRETDRFTDPLALLGTVHARIEARLARDEAMLRDEAQRRVRAEEELRESNERYTLAVSGANDGMWEWNLKTGTAFFSPRWKSMLGLGEQEIGTRIEEWHDRIHPKDRERVLAELQAHLDGHNARFEHEHRIRHRDGSWRWVLTRAAAVRHASGRAYRLVGLNTDISPRKQVQEVLVELADGMNGLHGEETYGALVQKFASILRAREAFLCECCSYPATRVRMLAYWYQGQFAPREEFDLAGTPCEEVILGRKPLVVARGVADRWPGERQWGTESYMGLPCVDTRGTVIGHLACKDGEELTRDVPHDAILKLFAVRASVEMERRILERARGHTLSGAVVLASQRSAAARTLV